MNALEKELQYVFADQMPSFGSAMEVAPGIKWVRMPLPFALDHINLWLIRDQLDGRQGWSIIDCGVSQVSLQDFWEEIFDQHLEGLPVLRVLVTHMHPDHVGLANWLCKRWNAMLWMSMTDYLMARLFSEIGPGEGDRLLGFFTMHGLEDPDAIEHLRSRSTYFAKHVPAVPAEFRRLMDGETIQIGQHGWQVITGSGHSPEHVSLHCEALNVLISGDMILPRISTNISVFEIEPESNPLPLYLDSIDKFKFIDEDALVLPSHGKPFKGLQVRIRQQHEHHQARLEEVREACITPKSVADMVPVLFPRALDAHQLTFAMGETLAHLHALYFAGELSRQLGPDDVYRFTCLDELV